MLDVYKDMPPVTLIAWHFLGAMLVAVMSIGVIWRLTHQPIPNELPPLLWVPDPSCHDWRWHKGNVRGTR